VKKSYDFSKGRRGAVVAPALGKARITIRLDEEILEWFKASVEAAGGGNYQTLINAALRQHIRHEADSLEKILRRVLREELAKVG
jgi:uncharacterized protein (DUF4415 family)